MQQSANNIMGTNNSHLQNGLLQGKARSASLNLNLLVHVQLHKKFTISAVNNSHAHQDDSYEL